MQRFKTFAMAKANVDIHGQPVIFGAAYGWAMAHPAASIYSGKFNPAAIRAHSNASIARTTVFALVATICDLPNTTWHKSQRRSYLASWRKRSSEHGYRLPS
jgi:hypothetical protein